MTIFIATLYIILLLFTLRTKKRLTALLGNELIEIDNREIRIKSKKGTPKEIIKIDEVDKLILKEKYSMAQETIKDVSKEISGKTTQNYLILVLGNQSRRFDFEMDSYYMINQLHKIIGGWQVRGYNIERIKPMMEPLSIK